MPSKKRNRKEERPTIHPKNKYSENPPDFALLASLYPSFEPFVFYSRDGRPRIDWTDFNATRELTRVLLLHDHALNWWIPDGQLCPTVPNRSNYIHWIEDLLSSDIIPSNVANKDKVRGFDIGTGANCIYPLLGASLLGWNFVGSDVAEVALEWAQRNVNNNPQIVELIEIRKVETSENTLPLEESHHGESEYSGNKLDFSGNKDREEATLPPLPLDLEVQGHRNYHGPPILLGVIRDGEKFDFCMCNPPFFENMEKAGLNPKTSCGGTPEEMVCPGGEKSFITRIIEDSAVLKDSFRWYTSMIGRKSNLKSLISKLREVGVTIVKTTEFVQGQTCRWGLAWSFLPPVRKIVSPSVREKSTMSFMLEGISRQHSALHVLQTIESYFCRGGASCKLNTLTFVVDVTYNQCDAIQKNEPQLLDKATNHELVKEISDGSLSNNLCFRVSVFQQIPGTLLVKGALQHKDSPISGSFSSIFQKLEEALRGRFCTNKRLI
ncbi:U6 small nuclear RNA (adenine-(43)-N(6))-methyltransferase [Quillaja saponaria]|uniref:U6 small nuclear RNA (adenine-(43)-N(6))-methyltransferase n=1 Tax=Quillaja saponaria TaxID=32244 RepID=A0AAD7M014_QUISA|nr:U6 small nuclear RNA (adenine-(43)-N(6))-methyltransferase [Quillaja saponaria]